MYGKRRFVRIDRELSVKMYLSEFANREFIFKENYMSENNKIKCDGPSIAHGQAVVEARSTVDGECKILSVSAHAEATPGEVFTGEARYNGKVTFDCIALAGDKLDGFSVVAEFSDKIVSSDIASGMSVALIPEVVNTEASADGGAVKLTAVVDVTAIAVTSAEYGCVTELPDNVYAETQTVEHCEKRAGETETVYLTDGIDAGGISEVLFAAGRAVVTGADAQDGAVKVTGAVYGYTVGRTADGMITSTRTVTPFVKEISALGAAAGNVAYAFCSVESYTATMSDGRIELAATLCISTIAFECIETEAVTDVFCADNEFTVETDTACCCAVEQMSTVTDTVDGQISLGADRLAADTVMCVNGAYCTLSSIEADDKRATVEGLVGGDIVYYNAEKNTSDMISFRLPFSIPLPMTKHAGRVEATATVTDVSVRIRRESVFDIKAEIAFTLRPSTCKTVTVVKSVALGEPVPRPDAAIIVHIAKKGETLWQAAKALCCAPERVTEQNVGCSAPYAGGEKLINFCNKRN